MIVQMSSKCWHSQILDIHSAPPICWHCAGGEGASQVLFLLLLFFFKAAVSTLPSLSSLSSHRASNSALFYAHELITSSETPWAKTRMKNRSSFWSKLWMVATHCLELFWIRLGLSVSVLTAELSDQPRRGQPTLPGRSTPFSAILMLPSASVPQTLPPFQWQCNLSPAELIRSLAHKTLRWPPCNCQDNILILSDLAPLPTLLEDLLSHHPLSSISSL